MILIAPLPNCCHFGLFCSLYSAYNFYRCSISVFKQTSINVHQKSPLRLETVFLKLGWYFNALMARVIGSARWSEWPLKVFRLNNIWTPKYVCYKEGKKENPGRGNGHRGRKAWCLFKEYWVFLFCWESMCFWLHLDVIWLPNNVKLHLSSLRTSWRAPKCMQCPKRSSSPKGQTHGCLARWAKLLCGRFIWNFPLCLSGVVPVVCASASDPILLKII